MYLLSQLLYLFYSLILSSLSPISINKENYCLWEGGTDKDIEQKWVMYMI